MRFLGRCRIQAYYPVQSRDEAVIVVQKDLFSYSNGVGGSAIYLCTNKEDAFAIADWAIECEAYFDNAAEISINKGEFDDLFGIAYDEKSMNWEEFNERQRKIILWAGYDGFIIDKNLLAVYGNIIKLHAIKAFPKVEDSTKTPSYNTIWKKVKRISGMFDKERKSG